MGMSTGPGFGHRNVRDYCPTITGPVKRSITRPLPLSENAKRTRNRSVKKERGGRLLASLGLAHSS